MSWLVSVIIAGLMTANAAEINVTGAPRVERQIAVSEQTESRQTGAQANDRIDQTFPLAPTGRISLKNVNGAVVVEAVDRADVRLEAVKTIDCERPFDINVKIDQNPDFLRVEAEYPRGENTIIQRGGKDSANWSWGYNNRCREAKVDFKLTVPRAARLDRIETVNGGITINGATEYVNAGTVNGKIAANNLRGSINLSTVNGTLDVDFADLRSVRDVSLGMVNGAINLNLPSDIDAVVKADTVNGRIANDFGLPVRKGEYVGRNLYGKLGDGGVSVKLNGVNGTINVRRKADGRNAKPATNLLQMRQNQIDTGNDDEDSDDDDAASQAPRAARSPKSPRAPRTPRAPNDRSIGDEITNSVLDSVADSTAAVGSVINEQLDASVRESLKAAKIKAKAAKEAAQIDKEALRREVEAGLQQAREEMNNRRFDFDFDFAFGANRDAVFMPMSERETKTVAVSGVPNVAVNARGGTISIRGWDKPEVQYSLMKNAGEFDVKFNQKDSNVDLTVAGDSLFRLEIFVPRASNVRVNTDRQIRVENVKGNLQLEGDDESIDVRDAGGKLTIACADGNVRVVGFDGETAVKTGDGDIALEGVFSSLSTETVDGNVFLTLKDDAAFNLEATTKSVVFDGINPNGAGVDTNNSTVWRIGGGGTANYKMRTTAGGQIFVRSQSRLRANLDCFDNSAEISAE